MQNQLTHTVTESDLQKTIATLATKDDLAALAKKTEASMRELAERTDKSISELRDSIRDLRNDMWKVIIVIAGVVVAVAALL